MALPNNAQLEPLGRMEVDETQPCGSLPASPWSCSLDGYIPCGARWPGMFGMLCVSEDQLEANGGLVIFFPDTQELSRQPPAAYCLPPTLAATTQLVQSALADAFKRIIMPSGVPAPLPGTHAEVTLDRIHHLQCLRNTPLAGTQASQHSDFVFAWALLGRYAHELAWRQADLRASRPEPCISFGTSRVEKVRGVRTWGQGPYEQGFLPLLVGYGGLHSRMAILLGPDLFMANRFADGIPPPFVHGYGVKGKHILQQWGEIQRLPTLPDAIWGNGAKVPLWAATDQAGCGPVRFQLFRAY